MSENNKKYNIDELVNSLLLERQSELPLEEPDLDVTDVDEEENPFIMDSFDDSAVDAEEESDEEPVELLSFEELGEESAIAADEEIAMEEETFVSRIIEMDEVEEEAPAVLPKESAPAPKSEPSKKVSMPPVSEPTVVVPDVAAVAAATVATTAAVAATATPDSSKKRKKLFARKMEDTGAIEKSWADWGLKPIGHYKGAESAEKPAENLEHTAVFRTSAVMPETSKKSSVDEFPAVKAVAETITMQVVLPSGVALPRGEEHTRIVPTAVQEEAPVVKEAKPEPVISADEQLPDQLSLEEMVRVEDIEPSEDAPVVENPDMDPEERLQLAREEKVREFTLDGDEEVNDPDEEVEETETEIEDFTGYQDTQTVADELKYRCRSSLLSVIFTAFIQIALLLVTLLTVLFEESPITPMAYLLTHLFGLVLMMGLNYSTIARGLSGIFTLRANNDTAPALAATISLVDVAVHLMNTAAPLPYWAPLAGLLLTLSASAHHTREVTVRRNFAFVSYPGEKYSAAVIEDESALQEIGRRAVSTGEATVAYFRRTDFLTDYLTNAYDEDCGDDWSRWLTPSAFFLSLLLSLLTLLGDHVTGSLGWLSVFTGMICVSMPITMLAIQTPLSGSCRRMLSRGGFLNGWQAVRRFGKPDALAVDIADLYPDESMLLHGIKTFSGTHIDEAILTAASLAVRSGGPLAMIFRRIIENKEELLYEVDSLVYEQGMGLSGWVDGRRVFVGNSRLLQNHGVDVPSVDYEARYAKDGRRLVYLSIAGQLSAMFVVSYLPDPEIQLALQDLCRARVTLLVRSCDPNITTSDLCESFELDEYYVDVLPAAAGRLYMQLAEKSSEHLPAVMASNGHILGTARVLFACRGLQIKALIALIVQTAFAALGLILCLFWAMNGTLLLFQPLLLMLVSLFFTWFIPLFRRA